MMMSPSFLACTRSPFGMLHHQSSLSKLARNPAPPEAVDMSAFFFSFFFSWKKSPAHEFDFHFSKRIETIRCGERVAALHKQMADKKEALHKQ